MNTLLVVFAVATFLVGVLLFALRLVVVDILRIRKLSHKLDNPKPLNFADNLAWTLRQVSANSMSDRERTICSAYSIVWGLAIIMLVVTMVLTFIAAK